MTKVLSRPAWILIAALMTAGVAGSVSADQRDLVRRRQVVVEWMTLAGRHHTAARAEYRDSAVCQQIVDRVREVKVYPPRYGERDVSGAATVEFELQTHTGAIGEVRIVSSSGNTEIDDAAIASVIAADPCRLRNSEPRLIVRCRLTYDQNEPGAAPPPPADRMTMLFQPGKAPSGDSRRGVDPQDMIGHGLSQMIESAISENVSGRKEVLLAHLTKHKVQPAGTLDRHYVTRVTARFDGITGAHIDSMLTTASGNPAVDLAALETMRKGSPFPAVGQPGVLILDFELRYGPP